MSFGFEISNSSGNVVLSSKDTTFRIVHKQFCVWNYNSSFSVSDFDINVGEYYIQPHITVSSAYPRSLISTGTNYSYNFAGTQTSTGGYHDAGYWLSFVQTNKPTLSWNNSTKVMSVTRPSLPPFYQQSYNFWDNGGDYSIVFFEVA